VTTVLQIVHGYPPRELAGTELATARLVRGLQARGWRCHVLSSTRAPGLEQYRVFEEEGITRVVNNHPHRPLGQERDPAIEAIIQQTITRIRPDIVHLQHAAYLSSRLRFQVPAVGTLHDHWPWCPAGGTMLRPGNLPCPAPEAEQCLECYALSARLPGRLERAAVGLASALSSWFPPDRLHAAWRRLPALFRARLRGPAAPPGSSAGVSRRRRELTATWNALDARMAPSSFMARQAEHHGLDRVVVVPAGVEPGPARVGGGPFVFLGSILPHKGPHLVVEAYRAVFARGGPGLQLHGPSRGDPAYARSLRWPLAGSARPEEVPALLAGATALVMGSTWPENAPLVCLEARAAGCPVIAPRIGGIPELVEDGIDGLLYEPGSADSLATAMARLGGPQPPTLRVRPPPSVEAYAEGVEAVYRSVMDRGRSAQTRSPS
jgi:glycosyltransferase involved in cell wall biosynthesis